MEGTNLKVKTLILIIFLALPIGTINYALVFADSREQTFSDSSNVYTETVTFDPPNISSYLDKYDQVKMNGCGTITILGHPSLPVKTINLIFDLNDAITNVTVNVSSYELNGTFLVSPAPKASFNGTADLLTDPDPTIYSGSNPYPGKWYDYDVKEGIDPKTMNRVKFLILHLYPVQYSPVSGKITTATEAKISISYGMQEQVASSLALERISSPAYDLLIITSPALEVYTSTLAEYKNSVGISTFIKITDEVYSSYSGRDNPEKIRNYIKSAVESFGITSVLIFGDADHVPVRYVYIPDGYEDDGDLVETDLYYADLQYSWDDNDDGLWGDLDNDQVDGVPDLLIGRLPVSLEWSASAVVDKTINYERFNDPDDPWFNRVLLLGTDPFEYPGAEGEILTDYIADNIVWSNFTVKKLYRTYGNQTISNVQAQLNTGFGFVNYVGHGDIDLWHLEEGWWIFPVEYTSTDALNLRNGNLKLPVIFTMACLTSQFGDYDCIGEYFMVNPYGGAIAYFGASRLAWAYVGEYITDGLAGEMSWRFNKAFFDGNWISGAVWGQAITEYVQLHSIYSTYDGYYLDWKTVAEYSSPFMDPTLMIGGRHTIERSNIAFVTVSPYSYFIIDDLNYLNFPYDEFNETNIDVLFDDLSQCDTVFVATYAATSTTYPESAQIIKDAFINNAEKLINYIDNGGNLIVLAQNDYSWLPYFSEYLYLSERTGGQIDVYNTQHSMISWPIDLTYYTGNLVLPPDDDLYQNHFSLWENDEIGAQYGIFESIAQDDWFYYSDVTVWLAGQYGSGKIVITSMFLDFYSGHPVTVNMPFYDGRLALDNILWWVTPLAREEETYSASIIDLEAPYEVYAGESFTVDLTVSYEFTTLTTMLSGIFDLETLTWITEEYNTLVGEGTKTYSFELTAPEEETMWSLGANVWYYLEGEWTHNEEGYLDAFEISVMRARDFSIDYVSATVVDYADVLTVMGSGVTTGTEVNIFWDYAYGPYAHLLNATEGKPDGTFECEIRVPSDTVGSHYIWATDTATGETVSYGPITMVPKITLSPSSGLVGDDVTIKGYGFSDEVNVIFTFGWVLLNTDPTLVETDELGYFECTFDVPADTVYGTYVVDAEDFNGYSDSAYFDVTGVVVETGTLSITTTPVSGAVLVGGVSWGVAPQSQVVAVGSYTVSFGPVLGYYTPSSVLAIVVTDTTTTITGTYVEMPPSNSIILYEGWNLIGIPFIPDDPSIEVMLSNILPYVEAVWTYDGETDTWSSYSPGAPSNLVEMVGGKGYWIKMNEDITWTFN